MLSSTLMRSSPAPVTRSRGPARTSVRVAAQAQPAQLAAATFASISLLLAQPVFAAGEVPGSPGQGLSKPDGEVSTKGFGEKVAGFVSKAFPKNAFDEATNTPTQPASTTKAQEIKSVTQMLNEVATPTGGNKSIKKAAKGEADSDPTQGRDNALPPSSDPSYKQQEANVPLITNKV